DVEKGNHKTESGMTRKSQFEWPPRHSDPEGELIIRSKSRICFLRPRSWLQAQQGSHAQPRASEKVDSNHGLLRAIRRMSFGFSKRSLREADMESKSAQDVATARQCSWAYRERGSNRFPTRWRSGPCCPCRAAPQPPAHRRSRGHRADERPRSAH